LKTGFVSFKGVSEGVYIQIKGDDLESIISELDIKAKDSLAFFKGAKFLGIKANELSSDDLLEVKLILKYKYGFDIDLGQLPDHIKQAPIIEEYSSEEPHNGETILGIDEGITKFVYGTLRSGQEVEYEGNIVIIGDVNPGAILKAKGSIIVLGTLRGVAHAGLGGNLGAVVAAYNLLPTQLRINDIIVRPPDGDISQYKLPEVAKINNGVVVIEPYLPNK
jgi:septum site-determining protein MinC